MKKGELILNINESIEISVYMIRGAKVLLGRDLASLYGVETKVLMQAVKRNTERFPKDFMFKLTKSEYEDWKSQFVTSNSSLKMGLRKLPYVFTEQGVAMLSSVLRSPQAVAVNIEIMRIFIKLRQTLSTQKEVVKEIKDLKNFVLKHSHENDKEFKRIWQAIEKLTHPNQPKQENKIGFDLN